MSEPWSYEEQKAELLDAQCIYGIFHKFTDECIYVGQTSGKTGSLDVVRWGQHAVACYHCKKKWHRKVYVRMREDGLRCYELRMLPLYAEYKKGIEGVAEIEIADLEPHEFVFPNLLSEDELGAEEQRWKNELNPSCCMREAQDSDPVRRKRNKERYAEKKRKQAAARGEGQRPPNTTTLEQYGFKYLKSS